MGRCLVIRILLILISVLAFGCRDPISDDPNPVQGYQHEFKPFGTCHPDYPWGYFWPKSRRYCYTDRLTYWHEKCHVLMDVAELNLRSSAEICGDDLSQYPPNYFSSDIKAQNAKVLISDTTGSKTGSRDFRESRNPENH